MVHLVSAGMGEILTLKARVSLLVLYSNFIGVKWEKEALVPRVLQPWFACFATFSTLFLALPSTLICSTLLYSCTEGCDPEKP